MNYELGRYTVAVIGNKLLIEKSEEDGKFEKRIYKVDEAKDGFMWDILKTKIKFHDGGKGLEAWLARESKEDGFHSLGISFLNTVWKNVKQCKA